MAATGQSLQGRHALVTGAARGTGAEIARALAAEGARLSLLGRRLDALQALVDALPGVAKTSRSIEAARAEFAAGNPQGRIVQPIEVADTVRWLCGEHASAITGQAVSVSAGRVT